MKLMTRNLVETEANLSHGISDPELMTRHSTNDTELFRKMTSLILMGKISPPGHCHTLKTVLFSCLCVYFYLMEFNITLVAGRRHDAGCVELGNASELILQVFKKLSWVLLELIEYFSS